MFALFLSILASSLRSFQKAIALILVGSLLFLSGIAVCSAQNLVQNPSLEEYSQCPTTDGQLQFVDWWSQPTPGTPDYFNVCGSGWVGLPTNWFGTQAAHTGGAYVGLYLWVQGSGGYHEYLEVPLTSPLSDGVSYDVSFFVSLADRCKYATDSIGVYFSVGQVGYVTDVQLSLVPQVVNTAGNYLSDKGDWVEVTGTYVASGGEDHIVIGNFLDQDSTQTIDLPGKLGGAYVYIDDVSVLCTSCTPPPPGMVGWWPFDETSGTTAADIAGKHDGTYTACSGQMATPALGKVNLSLEFGSLDTPFGFVAVPDHPDLNFGANEDFSIDLWLKCDWPILPIQFNQPLIDKLDSRGYYLGIYDEGGGDQRLELILSDSGGPARFPSPTLYLNNIYTDPDTDWHHVTVTVDRDDPEGVLFYVDGAVVGLGQDASGVLGALTDPIPLSMAGPNPADGSPCGGYFLGRLDEVELFNRVLTPAEILALYEADCSGKCRVDCDGNGLDDSIEIERDSSLDLDTNGILDVCESDFDDFERYDPPTGGTVSLLTHLLHDQTVANGQGPSLVTDGVTYSAGGGSDLHWNDASYFGLPTRNLMAGGSFLDITYDDSMSAIQFSLHALNGLPDTATVSIFDSSGSPTFTSAPIAVAGPGPVLFSHRGSDIKSVSITAAAHSPIIDDHAFGHIAFDWYFKGPASPGGPPVHFAATSSPGEAGNVALVLLSLGDGSASGGIPIPGSGGQKLGLDFDVLANLWLSLPSPIHTVLLPASGGVSTTEVGIPMNVPAGLTVFYAGFEIDAAGQVPVVTKTKSFTITP